MKMRKLLGILVVALVAVPSIAQKSRPKPAAKARPIVFAVLNDGRIVEPIGYADKGKLEQAIDNAAEAAKLSAFHRSYYKPASV